MLTCLTFVKLKRVGPPVGQLVRSPEPDEVRDDDPESGSDQFRNEFVERVGPGFGIK